MRLVLLSAAIVIAAAARDVPSVVREFLATFSNEKFVVPICTAMGFAYVLKHTGCDGHLVKPVELTALQELLEGSGKAAAPEVARPSNFR